MDIVGTHYPHCTKRVGLVANNSFKKRSPLISIKRWQTLSSLALLASERQALELETRGRVLMLKSKTCCCNHSLELINLMSTYHHHSHHITWQTWCFMLTTGVCIHTRTLRSMWVGSCSFFSINSAHFLASDVDKLSWCFIAWITIFIKKNHSSYYLFLFYSVSIGS